MIDPAPIVGLLAISNAVVATRRPRERGGFLVVMMLDLPNERANSIQQLKTAHALASSGAHVSVLAQRSLDRKAARQVLEHYGLDHLPRFDLRLLEVPRNRHRHRLFLLRVLLDPWWRSHVVLLTREPRLVILSRILLPRRVVLFETHDLGDVPGRGSSWRERLLIRVALRCATGVITVTDGGVRALLGVGVRQRRIGLLRDAADAMENPALTRLSRHEHDVNVMYTGSLYHDRGADLLVEAIAHLPRSVRGTIVGGPMSEVPKFHKLIGELGLEDRVTMVEPVPHRDVPRLLAAADILCLPLRGGLFGEIYASPMKLFEYMASGRPIVASDLATVREVVDESTAYFFHVSDPRSLARAIEEVIADPEESAARAASARRLLAERHTYEARAKRLQDFLTEVTAEPPRRGTLKRL